MAFLCGNSYQTAVTRLTDSWLSAFNNRQISNAVFLDFCKAFDLVHHDILLKLYSYNLSMASITFLRSYLQGHTQCVLLMYTPKQQQQQNNQTHTKTRLYQAECLKDRTEAFFCFASLQMTCLCALHVHQCNVVYLRMVAPLIELTATYIIYVGSFNKV